MLLTTDATVAMRKRLVLLAILLAALLLAGALVLRQRDAAPIRVGVLHALSGTMAASEAPLVDAVRMAVDEINAEGGLLGRSVELVVADGRSEPAVFAAEAERLITQARVSALFACWTSACRKAVKPVVERHQHLMVYPVQYEGMEQSPHILYTGSAPNQQIVPGSHWAMERFGDRVFLLGSDYVFPRVANLIIRDLVLARGGEVLAERYVPLGGRDFAAVVDEIAAQRPALVLNTLNGDSNAAFIDAMVKAGLAAQPVMSFSVAEAEIKAWGGARLVQHYATWSYFQSLDTPQNRRFIAAWQKRFGASRPTSDAVEAAYVGVKLWAQAVRDAGSDDPLRVNTALLHQTVGGPSSIAAVDGRTRHLWKMVRIGHVRADGQFAQVFASAHPVKPAPWPGMRSPEAWQRLIESAHP
ncbi:urea ABC transporter substrate-binding protein [Niveibacterium sp. 24ML]|uniref:urea ABC transporter substrate-binding protein n=1 Tax=Niveibacterium sp. 24ML TaxID=2985512 RepID=UPI002270BA3C|nr:urea ABC transporter substrate-binding protein [Niveibacterium sp. 24ML]MCX9156338.1 urea ABC transporter substrate-binding protein [Niveibacterium sp. 24ML]